jgi:DNA-binding response OmpR family regulator
MYLPRTRGEDDVRRTYELGGNSFITKPSTFPRLVAVMNALDRYWFKTVEMPPNQ